MLWPVTRVESDPGVVWSGARIRPAGVILAGMLFQSVTGTPKEKQIFLDVSFHSPNAG